MGVGRKKKKKEKTETDEQKYERVEKEEEQQVKALTRSVFAILCHICARISLD